MCSVNILRARACVQNINTRTHTHTFSPHTPQSLVALVVHTNIWTIMLDFASLRSADRNEHVCAPPNNTKNTTHQQFAAMSNWTMHDPHALRTHHARSHFSQYLESSQSSPHGRSQWHCEASYRCCADECLLNLLSAPPHRVHSVEWTNSTHSCINKHMCDPF